MGLLCRLAGSRKGARGAPSAARTGCLGTRRDATAARASTHRSGGVARRGSAAGCLFHRATVPGCLSGGTTSTLLRPAAERGGDPSCPCDPRLRPCCDGLTARRCSRRSSCGRGNRSCQGWSLSVFSAPKRVGIGESAATSISSSSGRHGSRSSGRSICHWRNCRCQRKRSSTRGKNGHVCRRPVRTSQQSRRARQCGSLGGQTGWQEAARRKRCPLRAALINGPTSVPDRA